MCHNMVSKPKCLVENTLNVRITINMSICNSGSWFSASSPRSQGPVLSFYVHLLPSKLPSGLPTSNVFLNKYPDFKTTNEILSCLKTYNYLTIETF